MATVIIKDKNLKPENIKKGVTILKTTGTLDASGGGSISLQEKSVNSSTSDQVVTPGSGYDGLSKVNVAKYTLDAKTVDPSTSSQTVNSSADGLSSVTVNAVTSSIDSNISAGNIKKDVTILGVTGTLETGSTINNQDKSVNPSTNSQSVTYDSGYTGLGTVTVGAVTSSIDSNITAGNIKSGVAILGVTGTYSGSGGGDPWNVQAKKGQITDVSANTLGELGHLETLTYGGAFLCAGSSITNFPVLDCSVVADYGLYGAFAECGYAAGDVSINLTSVSGEGLNRTFTGTQVRDVSIHFDSLSGTGQFAYAFENCHYLRNVFIDASTINGTQSVFMGTFYEPVGWGIKRNITFTMNSIVDCYSLFSDAFNGMKAGTISFPNLTTISGGWAPFSYIMQSGGGEGSRFSMPVCSNHFAGAFDCTLCWSNIEEIEVHPSILRYAPDEGCFVQEAYGIKNVILTANASDNIYLNWQNQLTPSCVHHILTHLDLTVSGKAVTFWYDDENSHGLQVYDIDGSVQTAYDAATTAGWTINNLEIIAATRRTTYPYMNSSGSIDLGFNIDDYNTVMEMTTRTNFSAGNNSRYFLKTENWPCWDTSFSWVSEYLPNSLTFTTYYSNSVSATLSGVTRSSDPITLISGVRSNGKAYIEYNGASAESAGVVDEFTPTHMIIGQYIPVYELKLWSGWDTTSTGGNSKMLVHDLVPVDIPSTSARGLLDLVTGKFYS